MRTSVCALTLAALVALPVLQAVRVDAADHRDAPLVDDKPAADITDVFAFLDPNDASRLVLAMAVNPFVVPAENKSYSFGSDLLYQFKIDNTGDAVEDLVIQASFTGRGAAQQVRVVGPLQPNPDFVGARNLLVVGPAAAAGAVGEVIGDPAGVQAFAGLRDDAFVFDFAQFSRILGGSQDVFRDLPVTLLGPLHGRPIRADGTSGVDTFGGFNTTTIAVSLPKALIRGSGSRVNIWATVSEPKAGGPEGVEFFQIERMGQPAFATVFVPAAQRDAFNLAIPANDVASFSTLVPDALTTTDNDGTGNTIADRALVLTTLGLDALPAAAPLLLPPDFPNDNKDLLRVALLPDVIRLDLDRDPNDLAIGEFGVTNGRRLQDDVVDIELRLLRQLADVQFPDGSGLPGSGPTGTRAALDCTTFPCPDRHVLVVLQGTDFIKPDAEVPDVTTSGNDRPFPDPYVFPFFPSPHPVPGEEGTVGFPPQQ
jgi:hypothetical protein